LAEVRNRALEPLKSHNSSTTFEKILFLNDVIFSPEEASRLLFATNVNEDTGKADYKAACAMDFIDPFKYYDTYATRDLEGWGLGVPFFPYFSNAGKAESRKDMLAGRGDVRVKSCWGGMVAFDAQYFQSPPPSETATDEAETSSSNPRESERVSSPQIPIRFRAEADPFWDASECCLIHADLQAINLNSTSTTSQSSSSGMTDKHATGIYINPYVRVAYDTKSFKWLPFVKHFERLFSLPHLIANYFGDMPRSRPRRTEIDGETVKEKVWVWGTGDGGGYGEGKGKFGKGMDAGGEFEGRYEVKERVAGNAGYCGGRQLLAMKNGALQPGEKTWEKIKVPLPA